MSQNLCKWFSKSSSKIQKNRTFQNLVPNPSGTGSCLYKSGSHQCQYSNPVHFQHFNLKKRLLRYIRMVQL